MRGLQNGHSRLYSCDALHWLQFREVSCSQTAKGALNNLNKNGHNRRSLKRPEPVLFLIEMTLLSDLVGPVAPTYSGGVHIARTFCSRNTRCQLCWTR